LADNHLPVHRLPAGQELGLGDDAATPTPIAGLPAPLTLGLQAGGTLDAGDLGRSVLPGVAPGADAGHGVAVLVGLLNVQVRGPTTTPPGAADHLIVVLILGVAASGAARGALAGRVAAVG